MGFVGRQNPRLFNQQKEANQLAHSQKLEMFAKQIGFWAFNRYAKKQGLPIEQTLAVIRNVF